MYRNVTACNAIHLMHSRHMVVCILHMPLPNHNTCGHTSNRHMVTHHPFIQAHDTSMPTCAHNQMLNRHLNEATALTAQASNPGHTRPSQSKARSACYQPYGTGLGADSTNQSRDHNARNLESASNSRRTKPGGGNQTPTTSADLRGLSACAICLSRNPHDVAHCDAQFLWDGHTPVFAQKGDKGAKLRAARSGDSMCLDWNLPRACSSNSHLSRHRCSSCGSDDHGAQSCRLAQPKIQN